MQLKMTKTTNHFDVHKVRKLLIYENKFFCDLLSRTDVPIPVKVPEEEEVTNEKPKQKDKNSANTRRAKSLEDLNNKLNDIKQKRLQYVDKLLKKRLKTRMKKTQKKEERSQKRKLVKVQKAGGDQINVKHEDNTEENDTKPKVQKPVYNSEGKIVFSKFDFSGTETKKSNSSEKDPKKALDKLKKQKEKVRNLVDSGEQNKADEFKEKMAWKTALAKAGGDKVKDDPELLKKSIRRIDSQKRKSAKKWAERGEALKKAEHAKQQKREDNINKRKKDNKNKKLKAASKRGRVIPGF